MLDDERARDGVEHLQAAAREMLAAARAVLDVVEELVDDPATVPALLASLGTVARSVAGTWPFARPGDETARPDGPGGADDGGAGGVERIGVS